MKKTISKNTYGPEISLPLPSGCTLNCGAGTEHEWGGWIRIVDPQGNEVVYWDKSEWQEEPEEVIGAIFAIAEIPSLKRMLKSLDKDTLLAGYWVKGNAPGTFQRLAKPVPAE